MKDGEYVMFSDYDALRAENEELKKLEGAMLMWKDWACKGKVQLDALRAENEKWIKAFGEVDAELAHVRQQEISLQVLRLHSENRRLRELLKKIDSKLPYNARMACHDELGEFYAIMPKEKE